MSRYTAIESAETMAFMRAVVTGEKNLAVRSEDRLARYFLSRKYRLLIGISLQAMLRRALEYVVPGSYGFTITRTRHFDEILLSESRAGVEQVVLLGAGYDSRPFRFRDALRNIRVFEIDHPGTQARKLRMLARSEEAIPANVSYIPVDFNRQSLPEALADHGFSTRKRTLFLWEGVSYYLPRPVVEGVLDFVSRCAEGSSIVFDYALDAYVRGDTSTLGGREVARWLKRVREPFVFGLDPSETREFLTARKLHTVSDLGPEDLAQAYLKSSDGRSVGSTFGHIRMVHARASAANRALVPVVERRELNDRLRQTFTGGRVVLSPGVLALASEAKDEVLGRVRAFTAFAAGNPDHDFGSFDIAGVVYCFEVDCYARMDADDDAASDKPARTLTIMRADEY
jgi:methyltransferase (TIGR00027 family)